MTKATGIHWQTAKRGGFITAYLNDTPSDPSHALPYQRWFAGTPTENEGLRAIFDFEHNYAQLDTKEREPIKVEKHHTEVE